MWEKLKSDPEDIDYLADPSLAVNYEYAGSLSHEGRQRYLADIWKRRHEARVKQYTKEANDEKDI